LLYGNEVVRYLKGMYNEVYRGSEECDEWGTMKGQRKFQSEIGNLSKQIKVVVMNHSKRTHRNPDPTSAVCNESLVPVVLVCSPLCMFFHRRGNF